MSQELIIKTTSKIVKNNIDEFSIWLKDEINSIPTELNDEDDFGHAATDIKTLNASEKALQQAKDSILNGGGLAELTKQIDDLKEMARVKRLNLEGQVKTRKVEIKVELIDSALNDLLEKKKDFPFIKYFENTATINLKDQLSDSLKSKRTIESMKKALLLRADEISMDWKSNNDLFEMKETAILAAIKGNEALFSIDQLMTRDDWKSDIESRLAEIKRRNEQAEIDAKAKIEAEKAKNDNKVESETSGGAQGQKANNHTNQSKHGYQGTSPPPTFDDFAEENGPKGYEVRVYCGESLENARVQAAKVQKFLGRDTQVTLHKI